MFSLKDTIVDIDAHCIRSTPTEIELQFPHKKESIILSRVLLNLHNKNTQYENGKTIRLHMPIWLLKKNRIISLQLSSDQIKTIFYAKKSLHSELYQ